MNQRKQAPMIEAAQEPSAADAMVRAQSGIKTEIERAKHALLGIETAGEAAKRMYPQLFETAAEAAMRTHPQWFETAAETAKRTHPNLFESAAGIAARAILDKPISSYAHLNAFLAPTGVDIVGQYEAKQKAELQSLLNSISGVAARQASEKIVLASAAWMPIKEWPEVKPRFLGMDLHDAIEEDDRAEVERIMNDPAFGPEVLYAMHSAAKMSVEERAAIAKDLGEAGQTQTVIQTAITAAEKFAQAQKERARKTRKKTETGASAKAEAKILFDQWNGNPALYKNKAKFNQDVADKGWATVATANKWLNEFIGTVDSGGTLSDGLRGKLPKKN